MIRVDRAELTKNEIIRVAANRFLNDGFTKTTVASIAKLLNMSTGNMTFHFPTKDHMLAELVDILTRYQHMHRQCLSRIQASLPLFFLPKRLKVPKKMLRP